MAIYDTEIVALLKQILVNVGGDPNAIIQIMQDSEVVSLLKEIALKTSGLGNTQLPAEIFYATDNQTVFNTQMDLNDNVKVFDEGLRLISFTKTGLTQITTTEPQAEGTQIIIEN
jgi:hypothetical protein